MLRKLFTLILATECQSLNTSVEDGQFVLTFVYKSNKLGEVPKEIAYSQHLSVDLEELDLNLIAENINRLRTKDEFSN